MDLEFKRLGERSWFCVYRGRRIVAYEKYGQWYAFSVSEEGMEKGSPLYYSQNGKYEEPQPGYLSRDEALGSFLRGEYDRDLTYSCEDDEWGEHTETMIKS